MNAQATLLAPHDTPAVSDLQTHQADRLVQQLEADGVVRLPHLVSDATLGDMQAAFASRVRRMRWNNCDGYERTERWRYMVQDVLTLAQGFVDVVLHPLVKAVAQRYIGPGYMLCEAKGWRSLPTKRDFHGWHGDAWYDQTQVTDRVPRELKLAVYLTDVRSGAFQYIKGSHGQPPRSLKRHESQALPLDRMDEFLGPAGTAFLFDTSGIHRQSIPILEPRQAIFCNYHEASVPLQPEDVEYYRYHPLLLNAAFLGGLSAEDFRVLGFGEKATYQPGYARTPAHPRFLALLQRSYEARLFAGEWSQRIFGRLKHIMRLR
jgi:hypothetical protein